MKQHRRHLAEARALLLIFCLALCLLTLTACTRPADDVIRFGLASEPVNLDPRFATDATSARINRLLYQRLVDFDEHTRPVPALATWERLAGDHYRFHLALDRPSFHDGQPLTARDVAVTYGYILDPAHASPHRGPLRVIRRIEVLDDDTLDFLLERADPLLPGYLVIGILPANGIASGHPFQTDPVGSGPFRFERWPEPGRLRLVRLADGQRVEFLRIVDPTVRVLKLLRGEVDLLQNDLPAEMLGYLKRQDGIAVSFAPGSNFAYIGFNLQDPVTGDVRVRRAIAQAIDRAAIIRYLLAGAAAPAEALLPPDHWAGNPALQALTYDPEAARSLLAQAGYDDTHPLELDYKTSTDPLRVRIATIIQQQLAGVGIDMKLQSYDWGTFYGDIKAGRFQLYSLAWVGIKTPDIFRYAFHSASLPPEGANRGRLEDDELDELIDRAEQGATLELQAEAYLEVQARLLDLLPYLPLWYEDQVCAVRDDIEGYRLAPDGNYDALREVHRKTP
ncbi:MAG: ABC transporter substrate-binding protein [Gammaproteobacteria bacterium]